MPTYRKEIQFVTGTKASSGYRIVIARQKPHDHEPVVTPSRTRKASTWQKAVSRPSTSPAALSASWKGQV